MQSRFGRPVCADVCPDRLLPFYREKTVDDVPPVLTCTEGVLEVSVSASQEELLQGVTAWDNRDGDLTSEIMIDHISTLIGANTAKITYVVFDSSDRVAKLTRTIAYTDYEAPPIFPESAPDF